MHLRRRISDQINARIMAILPQAAATAWDHWRVTVVIEEAKFTPAGGIVKDGFERLFSVQGTVRTEIQTDDLDQVDLGEELVASFLNQPILLVPEDVVIGAISETAMIRLSSMRLSGRDASIVLSLTLSVSGEALRRVGVGIVPHDVAVPAPLDGIGEDAP